MDQPPKADFKDQGQGHQILDNYNILGDSFEYENHAQKLPEENMNNYKFDNSMNSLNDLSGTGAANNNINRDVTYIQSLVPKKQLETINREPAVMNMLIQKNLTESSFENDDLDINSNIIATLNGELSKSANEPPNVLEGNSKQQQHLSIARLRSKAQPDSGSYVKNTLSQQMYTNQGHQSAITKKMPTLLRETDNLDYRMININMDNKNSQSNLQGPQVSQLIINNQLNSAVPESIKDNPVKNHSLVQKQQTVTSNHQQLIQYSPADIQDHLIVMENNNPQSSTLKIKTTIDDIKLNMQSIKEELKEGKFSKTQQDHFANTIGRVTTTKSKKEQQLVSNSTKKNNLEDDLELIEVKLVDKERNDSFEEARSSTSSRKPFIQLTQQFHPNQSSKEGTRIGRTIFDVKANNQMETVSISPNDLVMNKSIDHSQVKLLDPLDVYSEVYTKRLSNQTRDSVRKSRTGILVSNRNASPSIKSGQFVSFGSKTVPGLINEVAIPQIPEVPPVELDEYGFPKNEAELTDEQRTARAFKMLAKILKDAKQMKKKEKDNNHQRHFTQDIFDQAGFDGKIIPDFRKRFILYPDGKFRSLWDLLMALCVFIACVLAPYMLAFNQNVVLSNLTYVDVALNILFFIDVILNFFTAFYDNDLNVIDDHKEVALNYAKSWFLIDLISIIPFDIILMYGNINRIARFSRIGKLYKIIRMTKMVRLLKIAKVRNKLVKNLSEALKIGVGFERLLFLLVIFLLMIHVIACLWIFIARFDDTSKVNWIYSKGIVDYEDYELYVTSFYFSVTTIVTVGYGDITAISVGEKIMAVFLMITGVIAFSFATGALSSIISNYDSTEAKLKEKMATLNDISIEYNLKEELFNKLVKTIKYDHSKKQKDVLQFMDELPHKLKMELAMAIHRKMYANVKFFDSKDESFIVWIGTVIRPVNIQEAEYIFKEGEAIIEIYFLVTGAAGYVLPRFANKVYVEIKQGFHFGHIDLFGVRDIDEPLQVQQHHKGKKDLLRKFTVQAIDNCDILTLGVGDLDKMRIEFPDIYQELYGHAKQDLKKQLKLKKDNINEEMKKSKQIGAKLAFLFMKLSDEEEEEDEDSDVSEESEKKYKRGLSKASTNKLSKSSTKQYKNKRSLLKDSNKKRSHLKASPSPAHSSNHKKGKASPSGRGFKSKSGKIQNSRSPIEAGSFTQVAEEVPQQNQLLPPNSPLNDIRAININQNYIIEVESPAKKDKIIDTNIIQNSNNAVDGSLLPSGLLASSNSNPGIGDTITLHYKPFQSQKRDMNADDEQETDEIRQKRIHNSLRDLSRISREIKLSKKIKKSRFSKRKDSSSHDEKDQLLEEDEEHSDQEGQNDDPHIPISSKQVEMGMELISGVKKEISDLRWMFQIMLHQPQLMTKRMQRRFGLLGNKGKRRNLRKSMDDE